MTDTGGAPSQYLLFDLNGQQVAVTDLQVDDSGRLRSNWVIVGQRLWSDEQTDQMLATAFKFLFENMEKTPDEPEPEPEPEPDLKLPIWQFLSKKLKELW